MALRDSCAVRVTRSKFKAAPLPLRGVAQAIDTGPDSTFPLEFRKS